MPPVRTAAELVPRINRDGQPDHLLCLRVEPDDVVHATHAHVVFLRVADSNYKLCTSKAARHARAGPPTAGRTVPEGPSRYWELARE